MLSRIKNQGYTPADIRGRQRGSAIKWLKRQYFRIPDEEETFSTADLMELDETRSVDRVQEDIEELLAGYEAYDEALRNAGLMDFSDQKLRALDVLVRSKTIRESVRARFKEIVVDECQDISRLEALLIHRVLDPNSVLVLAGDDDQSLYGFREANSAYLRDAKRYFSRDFETIDLNLNYRTPEAILAPALEMIQNNRERLPKSPHSAVHRPGEIVLIRAADESDLATRISRYVRENVDSGASPGDFAVLCTKRQVARMRGAITRAGLAWQPMPKESNRPDAVNTVTVDTMLSAKGRQWPVVILPDCTDGLLPEVDALRHGELESQRRLLYVAMTRSSERLVLGYASPDPVDIALSTSHGTITGTNGASRFLFEAGLVSQSTPPEVVTPTPESVPPSPALPAANTQATTSPREGATLATVDDSNSDKSSEVAASPKTGVSTPPPSAPKSIFQKDSTKGSSRRSPYSDWDLRAEEREALNKAATQLAKEPPEYSYAVTSAFPVLVTFLRRNLPPGSLSGPRAEAFEIFAKAREIGIVDQSWFRSIDRWRDARNRMIKTTVMDISEYDKRLAEEMVQLAPELFDYVRRFHHQDLPLASSGPEPIVIVATSPIPMTQVASLMDATRLSRIGVLADYIQSGLPHPMTGKAVKGLKFNPETFREEMIVLQLHLLLRDVRFHIGEDYRWTGSAAMDQLCRQQLGSPHASIRPRRNYGLSSQQSAHHDELVEALGQVVTGRYPEDSTSLLDTTLYDAMSIQNGSFTDGFKIRAYRK